MQNESRGRIHTEFETPDARRRALESVLHSSSIEGAPPPSPEYSSIHDRWVAGEIDREQMVKEIKLLAASKRPKR